MGENEVRFLFSAYRVLVSPVMHWIAGPYGGCRFQPTCSEYCEEAIRIHGAIKGGGLGLRRILSCHPYSRRNAIDPVPPVSPGLGLGPEV